MDNQKLQTLADTLSKSGLAASQTEAVRMAKSIISTEKKVAKDFDDKAEVIDDSLTNKSYQEEINDLIEKTSPEHKNYHIPISGYSRDDHAKNEEASQIKEIEEVEEELNKAPEIKLEEEPKEEESEQEPEIIKTEPIEMQKNDPVLEVEEVKEAKTVDQIEPEVKLDDKEVLAPASIEIVETNLHESNDHLKENEVIQVENKAVNSEAKLANSDVLEDEGLLKDIMNEDAQNVYSSTNKTDSLPVDDSVTTNQPDIHVSDKLIGENPEVKVVKEEFIVDVNKSEIVPQVIEDQVNEPDQDEVVKEHKNPQQTEQKKEYKNPIDNVDLMNYFRFG